LRKLATDLLKLRLTDKVDALFHVKSLYRVTTLIGLCQKNGILSAEEKHMLCFTQKWKKLPLILTPSHQAIRWK